MTVEAILAEGIAQLPVAFPEQSVASFVRYLQLLEKWNGVHNLTAIRNPEAQVRLHILDALAILPLIDSAEQSIADIGSGAGIPGLMLAIARPHWQIALVEANRKKVAFLREAKRILRLDNVTVYSERVERLQIAKPFSLIVSRALASIDDFLSLTEHLGDKQSIWGLMKAHDDEVCHHQGFIKTRVEPIHVPFVDAPRLWIELQRMNNDK